MLAAVAVASAHPPSLPHLHDVNDPAAYAVVAFWTLAGVAWLAWAARRLAPDAPVRMHAASAPAPPTVPRRR